ncbi:SDR family NAD(P)-dependent oxidoreductase [Novosphingobium sp. NBM11]|uniref:SDR family NAD(P)-dependent oxidoreductase n=1 Tax=Novosphingobium sp. NBM11 TaxID=2596914 RepID=UPI0018922341|nr:SDR family NAD(P)-dependent oxidoreductase [Novosphingobium sp. NBM11]MBF5090872.1 SDR family NAD(P)-dependent oxidoreductase [Novosphingobium sp. NBM11]
MASPIRFDVSFVPAPQTGRVLVVGASGELGGALARHYARAGARLSLWGRNSGRLDAVAAACLELGAGALGTQSLDLTDTDAALDALAREEAEEPFSLALFAAGCGDVRAEGAMVEDAAQVARLGQVNFVAQAAMAARCAQAMAARGHGAIVVIGSAAADHALPFAAAYAGSKAGLARFTDALRIGVQPYGVSVTLVSPGFIDTAAARRVPGPKPLILQPDRAAALIAKAAARGKAHLILPWPFGLLRLISAILPRFLRDRLLRALTPPGV